MGHLKTNRIAGLSCFVLIVFCMLLASKGNVRTALHDEYADQPASELWCIAASCVGEATIPVSRTARTFEAAIWKSDDPAPILCAYAEFLRLESLLDAFLGVTTREIRALDIEAVSNGFDFDAYSVDLAIGRVREFLDKYSAKAGFGKFEPEDSTGEQTGYAGNIAVVRRLYELALRHQSDYLPAWYGLAGVSSGERRREALQELSRLDDKNAFLLYLLAIDQLNDGRKEEALRCLADGNLRSQFREYGPVIPSSVSGAYPAELGVPKSGTKPAMITLGWLKYSHDILENRVGFLESVDSDLRTFGISLQEYAETLNQSGNTVEACTTLSYVNEMGKHFLLDESTASKGYRILAGSHCTLLIQMLEATQQQEEAARISVQRDKVIALRTKIFDILLDPTTGDEVWDIVLRGYDPFVEREERWDVLFSEFSFLFCGS